jgi:hypothetical protein
LIASYKHGFVFIKTQKTAGSSIEFALSPHCGPQDIVAPIGPSEDRDRFKFTGVLPQNFATDADFEARYIAAVRRGHRKRIRDMLAQSADHGGCQPHEDVVGIRRRVPPDFWQRALKITAERHPYEKAVSRAWFSYKERDGRDFPSHLDSAIHTDLDKYAGFQTYSLDGKCAVDVVLLHETLQADLDALCARLGLPPLTLPFRRSHTRKDRRPAREVLSESQKAFIAEACRQEFELFGWER